MRPRQTALLQTVPLPYSVDEPVNHGDRFYAKVNGKQCQLRRAKDETPLLLDNQGHGWIVDHELGEWEMKRLGLTFEGEA